MLSGFLLGVDLLLVELQLPALKQVAVGPTALPGAARDAGEEPALVELGLELVVFGLALLTLGQLALKGAGLLDLLDLLALIALLALLVGLLLAYRQSVVGLEPLLEGGGVDEDDAVLDEGLGTDELVVGGVVDHVQDPGLEGHVLAPPAEVALLQSQRPVLEVAPPHPDRPHPHVVGQPRVGRGPALLKGPLLLVNGHAPPREPALVP